MNKRALITTFLGILLLALIACFGGDGQEISEQSDVPTSAAPSATAVIVSSSTASATEVPSPTAVATEGELSLQLVAPTETEVFTDVGSMSVAGRTRVDAIVTINDTIVEPNIDGHFSLDMPLEESPNIIEVVASVASGEQMDLVLVAVYVP